MLLAFLGHRADQRNEVGHIPADFVLEDFCQRDVRRAHVAGIGNERTAHGAAAGVKLAHTARNEVDQNVGIANLLQCFFTEFSVQGISIVKNPANYSNDWKK